MGYFFCAKKRTLLSVLLVITAIASGCGATSVATDSSSVATPATTKTGAPLVPETVDPSWNALVLRIMEEAPHAGHEMYFSGLDAYSESPMGTKIRELHRNAFGPKKTKTVDPTAVPSRIYKGFVTEETVRKCKEFLETHKAVFTLMEQRYGVPKETVVALLYVETKLGTYLGKEKAFWSLACMAAADTPEKVKETVEALSIGEDKSTWLQAKLNDKSGWAYKELRALMDFSTANGLDPQSMQGSVYGAIGLCQFMPSNLIPFGDDGNGDGKIDLFCEDDAIVSVGKYLSGHGWKGNLTVAQQRQVLKRYNNLNKYANTILALAASIKTGIIHTGPPDAKNAKKSATPQKKYAKKKATTQKNTAKSAK